MTQDLHDELVKKIGQLRRFLSYYSTESAVRTLSMVVRENVKDAVQKYRLSSPFRQTYYMLSLLLTTPEPVPGVTIGYSDDMEEIAVHKLCELAEDIYQTYADAYFPSQEEIESGVHMTDEWRNPRFIAMPVFLKYFNTTRLLASVEQITERVESLCVPFDNELLEIVGISATDALRVSRWISDHLQSHADQVMELARYEKEQRLAFLDEAKRSGWGVERMREEAKRHPTAAAAVEYMKGIDALFTVSKGDLEAGIGVDLADTFWRVFTIQRGEIAPESFTYPTDPNPTDSRPLFLIRENLVFTAIGNPLFWAVLTVLSNALVRDKTTEEKALRLQFLKHRDQVLERQTEAVLRGFFGEEAKIVASVYEKPNSQYEHDLVVLYRGALIIVECKAGSHAEPFRDPSKAFTRIRHEFRSEAGIQKGFEQAERLRKLIDQADETVPIPLYDSEGKLLLSLKKGQDFHQVFTMCVTADNFGMLAVDLSMLLEKSEEVPYPWCVNIIDLQTILDGIKFRGWDPDMLYRYLEQRSIVHGKASTTDELEVAGIFITEGNLDFLVNAKADRIFLTPDDDAVFEDIFLAKQNGESVDFTRYPRKRGYRVGPERDLGRMGSNSGQPISSFKRHSVKSKRRKRK